MLFSEFCVIFQNNFFIEHLQAIASVKTIQLMTGFYMIRKLDLIGLIWFKKTNTYPKTRSIIIMNSLIRNTVDG